MNFLQELAKLCRDHPLAADNLEKELQDLVDRYKELHQSHKVETNPKDVNNTQDKE